MDIQPDPNIALGYQIDFIGIERCRAGTMNPEDLDDLSRQEFEAYLPASLLEAEQESSEETLDLEDKFAEYREAHDAMAAEMQDMTTEEQDEYLKKMDELRESKSSS